MPRSFLPTKGVTPLELHHTGHLGEKLGKAIKHGAQFAAQGIATNQALTNRAAELRQQVIANKQADAEAKTAATRNRLADLSARQSEITSRQKESAARRRTQASAQSTSAKAKNAEIARNKAAQNINSTQFGVATPTPAGARTPRRSTWSGGAPATTTRAPRRASHPGGTPIQTGKRTSLSTNPL